MKFVLSRLKSQVSGKKSIELICLEDMEFYRSTTVGTALIKTLNELLASEEITNEQALEVLVSSPSLSSIFFI